MYLPQAVVISDMRVTCGYNRQALIRRIWLSVKLLQVIYPSMMCVSSALLGRYTNVWRLSILASILVNPMWMD
jgi:hypothetical protein